MADYAVIPSFLHLLYPLWAGERAARAGERLLSEWEKVKHEEYQKIVYQEGFSLTNEEH
jgi:hypothetical protein